MKEKHRLAVFDVDGTLLDTGEGIRDSVLYTINYYGFSPLTDEQLDSFIGPPIQDSFARLFGVKGEKLQEIATVFRSEYSRSNLLKAVPYEGIYEALDELKARGVEIAIATYKREDYARTLLKHFGFDRYTQYMFGADHENRLKKCEIIQRCLDCSGITDKNAVVMIGDSDNDAIGAEKLGIDFVAVTYGYGFRKKEEAARFNTLACVDSARDIPKVI